MGIGQQRERELVNFFKENWKSGDAMRLAASGGGSTADLPDVFATVGNDLYAIEQKYAGRGQDYTSYVQNEEQVDLRNFAHVWGAEPLIVFRFSNDTTWYAVELYSDLHMEELTEAGSIGGKRKYRDRYETLEEIVNE